MQAATKIAVLLFLSVGFANGQDEGLLGLPVDFDLFGLDFRNEELYKEQDIFKDDDTYSNPYLDDTIRNLCNQYDLIVNNQQVDCETVRLVQKGLNVNKHNLHKREAGDEAQLDEGSGAGENDQEPAPEPPTNEEPAEEHIAEQIVEEESKSNDTAAEGQQAESSQEVKEEEAATELPTGEETPGPEPSANEPPQVEAEAELPKIESPTETDTAAAEENHSPAPEANDEQPQVKENEALAVIAAGDTAQPAATGDSEGETTVQPAQDPATESAVVKESDAAVTGGVRKKGRVLKPTGFIELDKTKESENTEGKEDTEALKEHQSGIAVFHGAADKGSLEGTDDALNSMKQNENLKQAPSESQEQTGESTKEIKEGRKDTKVLIILFVAVVVVGGAAFAYNFIKKRKQKKAEATENGANNVTPRNLQNLTNSAKSDPEHGTELKPLMKNAEQKPVVAEYTDEKENVKTEVGK